MHRHHGGDVVCGDKAKHGRGRPRLEQDAVHVDVGRVARAVQGACQALQQRAQPQLAGRCRVGVVLALVPVVVGLVQVDEPQHFFALARKRVRDLVDQAELGATLLGDLADVTEAVGVIGLCGVPRQRPGVLFAVAQVDERDHVAVCIGALVLDGAGRQVRHWAVGLVVVSQARVFGRHRLAVVQGPPLLHGQLQKIRVLVRHVLQAVVQVKRFFRG